MNWQRLTKSALSLVGQILYPEQINCICCGGKVKNSPLCPGCVCALQEKRIIQPLCLRCGTSLQEGKCPRCAAGPSYLDRTSVPYHLSGIPRQLVHRFKYDGILTAGEILMNQAVSSLPKDFRADVITYVTMPKKRAKKRKIDHGKAMASMASSLLNLPVQHLLIRSQENLDRTQQGLNSKERSEHLNHLFTAEKAAEGKNVLLIDDVLTTGATSQTCAKVLKQQGANHVHFLALTKTVIHREDYLL